MEPQPASPPHNEGAGPASGDLRLRLRLLSFNIQVALDTRHAGHYLTGAWRHALPHKASHSNLELIAQTMRGYDFVAIQEGDAGSLRTRFRNQIEFLAEQAGYPYHGLTVTRDLHPIARHCLGFLSRHAPASVEDLELPSPIPGRRALRVQLGADVSDLSLIVTHLSLGRRAQERQLEFLARQVAQDRPAVLLGDLNCEPQQLFSHAALQRCGLVGADAAPPTYPSWRPTRSIDHVLVTRDVRIARLEALPLALSDHLPLAAEIDLVRCV
jgi:endonuclease/exonuclease/phosphatase family metal-dependent hydrolase